MKILPFGTAGSLCQPFALSLAEDAEFCLPKGAVERRPVLCLGKRAEAAQKRAYAPASAATRHRRVCARPSRGLRQPKR